MDRMRLAELEAWYMEEIVRRRKLGEYNPDAKTILKLCEDMYELYRDMAPKTKKRG